MYLTALVPWIVAAGVLPLVPLTAMGVNAWLVVGAWLVLCVALVAADVAAAPDPRALSLDRSMPARVRLGEPVEVRLRLANRGARRIRATVRDAWQPTAGAPAARLRFDVPPHEARTARLPLLPRRRGELRTEFAIIRSVGPLGLAGVQRRMDAPGAIRVLPPFHARRHLPSRLVRLRELDGNTSVQVRGRGTEFDSLREYVRGDDVRSIDWRATARASTTMLRTWRPERDRHVVIVIDTGRTAATRVGDGTRLDAAFESALLLAALAARAGDHVHLVAFDRVVRARVTGVDGPALLPALVDALAPVEAQLIDTDWDGAFAQARALAVHPSLLVVLTAQEAPEAARGFLGTLPQTVRAGTVVLVGTATDADLESTARARGSVEDLYRAAAAEAALRTAGRVARAITRAGAEALAAPPDDLPPRIADRYLALKAAGRL
ncbi:MULTISPECIES: DUF58 domain-containing protein [unclassified Microbacterium]|uniref:DUF58 domain-containing protein n=1 Tax=unclassified Microbacterium TaxID=2609290 RepID=UPI0006FCA0DB|nr:MULTISPECIES: DUF58 domain-containing protein [unclassified Microbacterium]KQZ05133.1 hypothetical protein ASD19_03835 [Microbacterium sp. Root53]